MVDTWDVKTSDGAEGVDGYWIKQPGQFGGGIEQDLDIKTT